MIFSDARKHVETNEWGMLERKNKWGRLKEDDK